MDFLAYIFEHAISFGVASIPLVLVFFQMKICKIQHKAIVITLVLSLVISIYFWIRLSNVGVFFEHSIPYATSFIWVWADFTLQKNTQS